MQALPLLDLAVVRVEGHLSVDSVSFWFPLDLSYSWEGTVMGSLVGGKVAAEVLRRLSTWFISF